MIVTRTFERFLTSSGFGTAVVMNDNEPLMYHGVCRWCGGEQVSNDPDVSCLRCKEAVEYKKREPPT